LIADNNLKLNEYRFVTNNRSAKQSIDCYYQNTDGCDTVLDEDITKVEDNIVSLAGKWCDLSRPNVCEPEPVCEPAKAIETCFVQPGQYVDKICE